jgi:hypothetical protein
MSDFKLLQFPKTQPTDAFDCLDDIRKADPINMIACGWSIDGEFFYRPTDMTGPEALWLLQLAIKKLMEAGEAVSLYSYRLSRLMAHLTIGVIDVNYSTNC